MKKNWKRITVWLLALTVVLSMAGIASASEEDTEPAEAVDFGLTEEETAALPRIGDETEDCSRITVKNCTESDITAVSIRASGDAEWSENLLAEDDVLEAEALAVLCFEPEEKTLYDIQFTFSDSSAGAIHDVDFADVTQAELHRQDNGLIYIVYTSLSTEETEDTYEAELARAEEEIAAGAWEYGDELPGSSADDASEDTSSNDAPSNDTYTYSSGSDSGCLTDALLW